MVVNQLDAIIKQLKFYLQFTEHILYRGRLDGRATGGLGRIIWIKLEKIHYWVFKNLWQCNFMDPLLILILELESFIATYGNLIRNLFHNINIYMDMAILGTTTRTEHRPIKRMIVTYLFINFSPSVGLWCSYFIWFHFILNIIFWSALFHFML